jgi:hypothetical protein
MKDYAIDITVFWVVVIAVAGVWLVNHAQQIIDAVMRLKG